MRQDLIDREVEDLVVSGVVLTGGGSLLDGSVELAEQIFGLPVRRGVPLGITSLFDSLKDPSYATGVGLVQFASRTRGEQKKTLHESDTNLFSRITSRMKGWFQEFF